MPVAPGIAANSIVAVQGGPPYDDLGDGVVKYASAHRTDCESELVVALGALVPIEPDDDRRGAPHSCFYAWPPAQARDASGCGNNRTKVKRMPQSGARLGPGYRHEVWITAASPARTRRRGSRGMM